MIKYRTAEKSDVSALKVLTDEMLADTALGVATPEKIYMLVTSPRTLVMLAVEGEKTVGFICGVVHESMFNDRRRVTDIGLFVSPEYRHSTIAEDLVAHLEKWARDQQAEQVWLGQTTGGHVRLVERFYNRLGYKTQGFNCVKEL